MQLLLIYAHIYLWNIAALGVALQMQHDADAELSDGLFRH